VLAPIQHWLDQVLPLAAAFPRALALMLTIPLFPKEGFAFLVRNAVAVSLLLGVYPLLAVQIPPLDWGVASWIGFALKEVFIGFILGYALGSIFWVFQSVGELIDNQIGLNNASIFDPFGGHAGGPYAGFLLQLSVIIFIAIGGLQLLSGLLYESYTLWPMHSFVPKLSAGYEALAREGFQRDGALVMTLVAPIVIVLVLVELAVGLVNRATPQLNGFYFSMPIKGVMALLMLVAMVSPWADALRIEAAGMRDVLMTWVKVWR
jgi:type III secretion protein T